MIALEPVDAATVTILVDNLTDAFMQDEGPARRFAFTTEHVPRARAATLEGDEVSEQLRCEHGFSALVRSPRRAASTACCSTPASAPTGSCTSNMRFLEIDPETVETVVLSHGHFDHTTGLDGFVRAVGRANIPVVIHPEFWN